MKEGKICIYPGCADHSSYCREHDNLKSRERHNLRYKQLSGKVVKAICVVCGTTFMTSGHRNTFCSACCEKIRLQNQNNSKYIAKKNDGHRIDEHRRIAKQVGAITQPNDVVHHMDGNKSNNDPSNLVVLSLANHTRLHAHLRAERIRQPNKTIAQLSWEFIWQNFIPYCFCNQVPGYHFPLSDLED